ncbi:hypothetical protein K5X82_15825 [Halosquirtibacter xylanolyticus]|uniref:hypothetical protein n=1 Tax=Halosquirtibacter xylanolyticus TaxID=3374599 RepID=UPI003749D17F|nr:hypothetical protein K5X82_15825 [Prolixibacteraceae bacterium]
MKKIVALLVMSVLFVACSNSDKTSPDFPDMPSLTKEDMITLQNNKKGSVTIKGATKDKSVVKDLDQAYWVEEKGHYYLVLTNYEYDDLKAREVQEELVSLFITFEEEKSAQSFVAVTAEYKGKFVKEIPGYDETTNMDDYLKLTFDPNSKTSVEKSQTENGNKRIYEMEFYFGDYEIKFRGFITDLSGVKNPWPKNVL